MIYAVHGPGQFTHCWSVCRCGVYRPNWVEYVVHNLCNSCKTVKALCTEMGGYLKDLLKQYTDGKRSQLFFIYHIYVVSKHSLQDFV